MLPIEVSSAATSDAARATFFFQSARTNKPELTLSDRHGLLPFGKFVAKAASESGAPPGLA